MAPYKRTNKVHDIEKPISTGIFGRAVLGINPEVSALSSTSAELPEEESGVDFTGKPVRRERI